MLRPPLTNGWMSLIGDFRICWLAKLKKLKILYIRWRSGARSRKGVEAAAAEDGIHRGKIVLGILLVVEELEPRAHTVAVGMEASSGCRMGPCPAQKSEQNFHTVHSDIRRQLGGGSRVKTMVVVDEALEVEAEEEALEALEVAAKAIAVTVMALTAMTTTTLIAEGAVVNRTHIAGRMNRRKKLIWASTTPKKRLINL